MAKATSSVPAKAGPTAGAPRPGASQGVRPDFGAELDAMIAQTPEAAEFGEIPDGKYTVRIDSATFNHSKASGRKQLSWQLGIVDGDFKGRKLFKHDGMESPEQLSWIRGSIGRLGFEWASTFAELQTTVTNLVGTYAIVTAKTKSGADIQNVYFDEAVDPAAVGAAGLEEAPGGDEDEADAEPEVVEAAATPAPAKATKPPAPAKPTAAPTAKPAAVATPTPAPKMIGVGSTVEIAFEDGPQRGIVKSIGKKGDVVVTLESGQAFGCKITDEFITLAEETAEEETGDIPDDQEIAEEQAGELTISFTKLNPLEAKRLSEEAGKAGFSAEDYPNVMDLIRDLCEYKSITGTFAKASDLLTALKNAN